MTQFLFVCAVCAAEGGDTRQDNEAWLSLRRRVLFHRYSTPGTVVDAEAEIEGSGAAAGTGTGAVSMKTGTGAEHVEAAAGTTSAGGWTFASFCAYADAAATVRDSEGPLSHGICNQQWLQAHQKAAADSALTLTSPAPSAVLSSYVSYDGDSDDATVGASHYDNPNYRCSSLGEAELAESLALRSVQLAEKQAELDDLQLAYRKLEKRYCSLKLELAEEKAAKY